MLTRCRRPLKLKDWAPSFAMGAPVPGARIAPAHRAGQGGTNVVSVDIVTERGEVGPNRAAFVAGLTKGRWSFSIMGV
jgi:hypothetical protein